MSYLDAKLGLRNDVENLMSHSKKRLSIYYFLEEKVKKKGDAEAIWSHSECLSWHQMYARVHQYAQWFLSQNVKPGDLVVMYMANSPDFICVWFGLMAIGAAPALINTNLASKALVHCVNIAQARLILADGDDEMLGRLQGARSDLEASGHEIVILRHVRDHILGLKPVRPADGLRKNIGIDSPMALAYTSGTTGLPKAIVFPVLIVVLTATVRMKGYHPLKGNQERQYNCMPYYHGTGGLSACQAIAVGDTVCISPKFQARFFWEDIRASKATYFIYVGEILRYLLARPPSPLDKTHGIHYINGNGLRADVWLPFRERFGITTIHEFYNSSEMMLSLSNASRGDFTAKSLGQHGALLRFMSKGSIIPAAVDAETSDLIRDSKTGFVKCVDFEDGGEILVKVEPGSTIPGKDFRGYWRNEEATSKKIAHDVLKKGDAYYRTGDAMRRDKDGRWFFCDRLGDTFRWKGENVSTTEVADVLGEYPSVVEANVYGIQLPGHDGRAGAVALLVEDRKKAEYAVPVFVRLTNAAYSTGNHKQNKVPLKGEGVDPDQVSNGDMVYWIEAYGKGNTYVPFGRGDWEQLQIGKAKL
ncbi:hypothetical protein N0V82_009830 [Gnomoniopsis sp. IMI 355080]|nr:hypothetical protein N0V82_009830 [Gnomoniopsis sp. IMI 355080]